VWERRLRRAAVLVLVLVLGLLLQLLLLGKEREESELVLLGQFVQLLLLEERGEQGMSIGRVATAAGPAGGASTAGCGDGRGGSLAGRPVRLPALGMHVLAMQVGAGLAAVANIPTRLWVL
jgi:hypothetical protein